MTTYHATLKGEEGTEFVHSFTARNRKVAWEWIAAMYPESRCLQLETQSQVDKTNSRIYRWTVEVMDNHEGDY